MKRIVIILFLFSISFSSFSQSKCAIERLEIYACKYDVFYSIYPSMDLIKEEGEYIRTSSFLHTYDSKLYSSLYNLEERPSEEVNIEELAESTLAVATVYYRDAKDCSVKVDNVYIMARGIVWKNRRYETYYPLVESVYFFYPERYYDKDYYRDEYPNQFY